MPKNAVRLDPDLWESIKTKYQKSPKYGGKGWNARKAQLAVQEYKRKGGRYSPSVKRQDTSLHKWTQEKWDYVGEPGKSRYLPEKVRKALSPQEKRTENRRKSNLKGQCIPYSPSVLKKFRRLTRSPK